MGLGDRINEIRKEKRISIDQLCEKSGIPKGTLSKITAGITTSPTLDTVKAIARALECTLDELDDCHQAQIKAAPSISDEAMRLAKDFDGLDTWGKKQVRSVADIEMERCNDIAAVSEKPIRPFIPFRQSEQPVSAGKGAYLGPEEFKTIFVEENSLTQRASFGVPVRGDSMEPRYHDGDVLMVEGVEDIDIGEIGVFTVNGEGFVKKRGEGVLISLNPKYDPVPLTEDSRCNGRVIGILAPDWIIEK